MKILIISPSLNIHGGIRVLVEWANHLSRRGHDVALQIEDVSSYVKFNQKRWVDIDPGVSIVFGHEWNVKQYDIVVAGTPSIANRLDQMSGPKKFFLLQMAEDLFAPNNQGYVRECMRSYTVQMPIIGISKWVEDYVRANGRGNGKMYYIGNGVSDHFRPGKKDKELTVLAEGWIGYNPAKDTDQITARVCEVLKQEYGAKIIAYSQFDCVHHTHVPDEYYTSPGTDQIRQLYQRAHFMVKATRFDARSCAPVEAMACGTPTVRGIERGDDDLIDMNNCLRTGYSFEKMIYNTRQMVIQDELRNKLTANGLKYRKRFLSWDYWMQEVEKIFNE